MRHVHKKLYTRHGWREKAIHITELQKHKERATRLGVVVRESVQPTIDVWEQRSSSVSHEKHVEPQAVPELRHAGVEC